MIYIRPSRKKALSFLLYVQGWVKLQCLSSYLPCVSSLLFRFLLFQRRRMEGKVVCVNQLKSTVEQRQKKWVISTEEVQAFNLPLSFSLSLSFSGLWPRCWVEGKEDHVQKECTCGNSVMHFTLATSRSQPRRNVVAPTVQWTVWDYFHNNMEWLREIFYIFLLRGTDVEGDNLNRKCIFHFIIKTPSCRLYSPCSKLPPSENNQSAHLACLRSCGRVCRQNQK